ncbi:hypothetical protein COCSUDRAFT_20202 [Coccomyxa subellipsoidea C-169]|uniref:Uncharacterized protein n=1 Tax=Coccomyxa subellipsoidea (strain C-169) TaxID=574566 RepID=I0YKH1_COCSC|nr:hypothetical protein COCSUDRAFT_20202 [Coccomyxa subellipsoidea C-169]EIE18890.1 hypothetical protein COCSUDRAFT_20202 [Coccomyxa subellipsoidea C-169]|eukprot:XP_005643434.1 hypothetical protein COCSUDRAFT_20202 [Coccomyxa subellipsoidea C-169]
MFQRWFEIYVPILQGPGTCDHNAAERVINIVTSLPFFALGWQAYRQAKSDESRLWGASIMGVGAGAVAFHASSGDARHWGRKLDYWVISLSTAALTRAVYPKVSAHKTAASLLLTPMQPLAVTSLNAAAMELEFLKQARKNTKLRNAHRVHMATTVLGAGCFVLEDFMPTLPLIHSVWHGLSAVALQTTNALVADADRRRLQATAEGV